MNEKQNFIDKTGS